MAVRCPFHRRNLWQQQPIWSSCFKDTDFSNKKILYYDETNSYLWDPTACAPANTLPSCFVDYEVPTEPIKFMLEQFLEHIAINEPDDSKIFERVTFTPKDELDKRKDEFEHLKCFFGGHSSVSQK